MSCNNPKCNCTNCVSNNCSCDGSKECLCKPDSCSCCCES